ncbi:Cyclophilin-like domain [Phytophthora cactorum]|nr:Cyclophilin-like domain [Phytophthora cactorum]
MPAKHERDEPAVSSDDEGPMPMPMPAPPPKKKAKKLPFEATYLKNLPSAAMYERSFMHRATVSHVLVAPETQFIITASVDGHVKFWKKMVKGIEFVKHYKAHLNEVHGLAVSDDGLRLCSTSGDRSIKFYDVLAFDMVNMLSVAFTPAECCWISAKGAIDPKPALRIYTAESAANEPVHTISKLHAAPVTAVAYNPVANCVISADQKGIIEYWDADTYKFPSKDKGVVKFKFKGETDLFELAKCKMYATAIDVSPDGQSFVVSAKDSQIRVFRFSTGKMRRKYDESLTVFEDAQADDTLHLDALDFGRRAAVERELANSDVVSNCVFDESATSFCLEHRDEQVVKVLGKVESSDRFLRLSLFQGKPKVNTQFEKHLKAASGLKHEAEVMADSAKERDSIDPTLFCTSFKRNRFFLFSTREPEEDEGEDGGAGTGRDVFNEKPTLEEAQVATESSNAKVLGDTAVMHTTMGDITLKLFGKECPKTVENFCTHARNGYYDNLIFHRVIKNFMVQTGDPLGDGTGGESIWGGEFEDEFHRSLRHDRPFTLSMANAGPGTNGSQFFLTTVPTPWLDNKHTVFGRVEHGKDTVSSIESARVDKSDKPLKDIKIINIDISRSKHILNYQSDWYL